jgi:hypothetical protein
MSSKGNQTYELTHARHDRAHCGAVNLFRPLKNGDRKKYKLEADFTYREENVVIKFRGPEPLDADDLAVLQTIVAEAAARQDSNGLLPPDPQTETQQVMRDLIGPGDLADKQNMIAVKTTLKRITHEAGYRSDTDKNIQRVLDCIRRLNDVVIRVQDDGLEKKLGGILGMKYVDTKRKNGEVAIALNPRIAYAITGEQYCRVDLAEMRSLKRRAAIIMHQDLCSWINQGKTTPQSTNLDTLIRRVWGAIPENKQVYWNRRSQARACLEELRDNAGWQFREQDGKITITRPDPRQRAAA